MGDLPTSSNGAPYNARWNNGVDSFIQKQSYGPKWLWSPNNLSQSVAGIKMAQPLAYGWSLIGTFEWGFNPYYGFPAAAQQSQVNQNGKALLLQGAGAELRAAPANRTTHKASSASATRHTAP